MIRPRLPRASRRGVLGGLVVAAAAAGCEVAPAREPVETRSPSAEGDAPTTPQDDPDEALVRRVVDDLTGALALVGGVARAGRPLAREVASWRRLHAAHLTALEAPDRARPLRLRASPPALRARVRREETALQRRLATAALAAESGPLAALLATMSAGVAQQLADDAGGRG